jgi:riboflavin synthase alpha subunit
MFSGIVEATGEVVRVDRRSGGVTLTLRVPELLQGLEPGSSVAVNGTCLTVVKAENDTLAFDAVGATMKRTLLGSVNPGARLNLERSLRVGALMDGHVVTGHVDGLGTVSSRRSGEGAVYFGIRALQELVPQIAPRGSIAVDGVSLTVVETRGPEFTISIVPYTLEKTIMGEYRPGRRVHLETDILAKYVQSVLQSEGERPGFAAWFSSAEKTS